MAPGVDYLVEWSRHKNVLQVRLGKRFQRPVKLDDAMFYDRVYRMVDYDGSIGETDECGDEPGSSDDGDDADDDDDDRPRKPTKRRKKTDKPSSSAILAQGTEGAIIASAGRDKPESQLHAKRMQLDEDGQLLRQYLAQSLRIYSYISLPVREEGAE